MLQLQPPDMCLGLHSARPASMALSSRLESSVACASHPSTSHPEGPSTQYLRTLVPKTIPLAVFGTKGLKYWVLGPSGTGGHQPCQEAVTEPGAESGTSESETQGFGLSSASSRRPKGWKRSERVLLESAAATPPLLPARLLEIGYSTRQRHCVEIQLR